MDCGFCATATLGYGRNLTAGEIVEQVYRATKLAGRRPTNLVFMGMGEPMHNFDNVTRALALLQHPGGPALLAAADHGLDGRPRAGHREARHRSLAGAQPRDLAQRDDRRGARPHHAGQPQVAHREAARGGAPLPARARAARDVRVRAARGRQRQRRRRRPPRAPAARHAVQGQPHPVEPLPGPAVRAPVGRAHPHVPGAAARRAAWPSTSARRAATTSTPPAASSRRDGPTVAPVAAAGGAARRPAIDAWRRGDLGSTRTTSSARARPRRRHLRAHRRVLGLHAHDGPHLRPALPLARAAAASARSRRGSASRRAARR